MGNNFAGSAISSMLAQYPDTKVMQAVSKLHPDDRPTKYPVRVGRADKQPILRLRPNTEGFVDHTGATSGTGKPTVWVNGDGVDYNLDDPSRLAANISHEKTHLDRGPNDGLESPAYKQQFDAAKRMGIKDKLYLNLLLRKISDMKLAGK